MEEKDRAIAWARGHGGYISAAEAESAGCSRRVLSELVRAGGLERVQRGLYVLPDEWPDDVYAAQRRFSRGIYRRESALDLFGLTERAPLRPEMAFPRGYNLSGVKASGIAAVTEGKPLYADGVCVVKTMFGNAVRAYRPERALCELAAADGDAQVEAAAFRMYFSSARFSGTKRSSELGRFAAIYRVEQKIHTYRKAFLC